MEYAMSVYEINQLLEDLRDEMYHSQPYSKTVGEILVRFAERCGYKPPVIEVMSAHHFTDTYPELFDAFYETPEREC